MPEMAILVNVDKCIRCNGCVIGCKRTHNMRADYAGITRMAPNKRLVIKSVSAVDGGPFVRFSCWHCVNPPCAPNCPKKAVKVDPVTKAVWIDHDPNTPGGTFCDPSYVSADGTKRCLKQCAYYCQRGGYPKVGVGSNYYSTPKSFKCSLCAEKISALPSKFTAKRVPWYAGSVGFPEAAAQDAIVNEPTCVYTCPALALVYDTIGNVKAHLAKKKVDGTYFYLSRLGAGHVYWVSEKYSLVAPKADPFVEDHVSPMVSDVLASPLAKALLVPTLVAGGLFAISARRSENEATIAAEEV